MAFNYTPLASTSTQLLKEFGRSVKLRKKGIPVYDPSTSKTVAGSPAPTEVSVSMAFFDFGEGVREERGNLVEVGDKRGLMAPTVTPSSEDEIVDVDGTVWSIVSIGKVAPGLTTVLYRLHLRHG
jgi:hypothetical protein